MKLQISCTCIVADYERIYNEPDVAPDAVCTAEAHTNPIPPCSRYLERRLAEHKIKHLY